MLAALVVGCGDDKTAVGAGSTLVAPLVAKWSSDYEQRAGVTITYGAIGSGGGIAQITARSIDFGASDAPLTPNQASACKNCVQVPWALGATLLAYNVKGAPAKLKLSGPDPDFPAFLRQRAGTNYMVLAKICVTASGAVSGVTLLKRAEPTLDNNVMSQVKAWRFQPMTANGTPAPFCYVQRFEFKSE